MPVASWKDRTIAEAPIEKLETVEGNLYFAPDQVRMEFLRPSLTHTFCPWKGTASYYDVVVDGEVNRDAAWFYPAPKDAAKNIAGRIAFWRGVKVG